jgi:hypothetical protein
MKAIILVTIVLAVLSFASCSDDENITSTNGKVTVSMVLTLQKPDVPVGAWVSATIRLRAESEEPIVLDFRDACRIGYRVYAGAKEIMAYPIDCSGEPGTLVVPNVGVVSMDFGVPTLRYDMENVVKNGAWEIGLDQLPAGVYRLRAGLIGYAISIPWVEEEFTVFE